MPRPSLFDDNQILEAAKKLQAEGSRISGFSLARVLGGGRASSLAERYEALIAPEEEKPTLPALPADLAESIDRVAAEVSQRLSAAMTEAHAALKAQAHARIDEVEAELAQAKKRHEEELDAAADDFGVLEERATTAEAALAAANQTLQSLQVQLSKQEGAATESARQIDNLKAEGANLNAQLQMALKENSTLAAQLAQTQEARTAAVAQAEDANKRREAAEKQAAGAEGKLEQAVLSLKSLQAEQAQMQKQIGGLETQLAAVVNEKQMLIDAEKKLKETHLQELAKAQEHLMAKSKELARAQVEIKVLNERVAEKDNEQPKKR